MNYRMLGVFLPAILGIVLVACSDGESIDSNLAPTGDAINREVLLNNLDDVRAMIADNARSLDPEMIGEVDYTDGRLRVVLAEPLGDINLPEVNSACSEISDAIGLPGLSVVVETADGSERAQCELGR
jgi:hypothetical protein